MGWGRECQVQFRQAQWAVSILRKTQADQLGRTSLGSRSWQPKSPEEKAVKKPGSPASSPLKCSRRQAEPAAKFGNTETSDNSSLHGEHGRETDQGGYTKRQDRGGRQLVWILGEGSLCVF